MGGLCAGRVAIVTGAGRGLGREYALMLAEQGAKVVVNDLGSTAAGEGADISPAQEVVNEIRRAGGEAIVNGNDVSDWAAAKAMIDDAVNTFGRLDVLINNAGILRDRMMVNMSEAEWDAVIKVHLKGTFAPSHHAAQYWRQQTKARGAPVSARLINTSSASGLFGNVGQSNYGAAKAGIAAFTVISAMELRQYGITVNAIAPRAQTRMTEGLRERTEEEIRRRDPRWVAPIAVWLASEQSAEVTGRVFEAGDGILKVAEGWHAGPGIDPVEDPAELGPQVLEMVRKARPNADIWGRDIVS
ncbi:MULTISPECIES: SDR family oxidoreductase [Bradyrhizobium]|jgi:NAD(P)-dependent dehydrogenase (short-subunit alcohol dehydrogenase family)|uniref:SDR family oxidoreductase n=1 Tax=Bradyrhizobium TaxID=374 RepID=UPI000429F7D5|nr:MULTISPECIES: SDR family oxidoreductase [Bradyrhizobium]AUC97146.1 short-chain dehydrogenase [Bradyrhizobium sp. SK17]KIU48283.1 short-chain dehydrogenase [Bradyrhizobium elkanii]OCX30761.1 short-chain dehydrogenase [Bradyrhizobium sp. UASWS1016]